MSKATFNMTLLLFAGVWLFLACILMRNKLRGLRKSKWLVVLSGLLILVGFGGFFAEMLSGVGVVKLPKTYEWPAGYVSGVKTTTEGLYLVPLVPQGRVQLYDSHWRFLRGWNIDAEGGDFRVEPNADGTIDVLTARGRHRYAFSETGELLSSATLSEDFYSSRRGGEAMIVPTSPLLWVFSGPAISWGVGVMGFVGLWLAKKLTDSQRKQS